MDKKQMKSLTIGDTTYEIVDGSARNDIENLKVQDTNMQREIAAERTRIDSFVALEEGSTTGDAELIDARVGADGFVYASVGHATRTQFQKLSPFFKEIKEKIEPAWETRGYYYDERLNEYVTNDYSICEMEVEFGELYYLTTYARWVAKRYIIVDIDNNVLQHDPATDGSLYENTPIRIPLGAAKMILQKQHTDSATNDVFYLSKVVSLSLSDDLIESVMLKEKSVNIQKLSDELQNSLIPVYSEVEVNFENLNQYAHFVGVGKRLNFLTLPDNYDYGWVCIPVKAGEKYKINGMHNYGCGCYMLTDEKGLATRSDGISEDEYVPLITDIEINIGEAYLYINGYQFKSLSKVTSYIPVIPEEYVKQTDLEGYVEKEDLKEYVKRDDSILYDKKIVYDGDSICESRTFGENSEYANLNNGGAYAKIIADLTRGSYVNQAVGGGILRSSSALGLTSHSVVDNLPNLPLDADLYCFEGGINDYWGNAELGTFSKSDYTGELDTTTVCGALETIFRYALNNFVGKPICFVIVHKVQTTAYNKNASGDTFEDYRNAMVGICNKYSIPYYDGFNESGLNGWNETQSNLYTTANSQRVGDGCHANEEGYKRYYVPQLIALFEKVMPRD